MPQSLIGVACRNGQQPSVKEFFQLFKTPWEFYVPGRSYSVVISTCGSPERLRARLLVEYQAAKRESRSEGITYVESDSGSTFPVYGNVSDGAPVITQAQLSQLRVIRAGYDLFEEVEFLLSSGQPPECAAIPTLEIHISMLRDWILASGIPLVEIPPVPDGYEFIGCLTHDVDFIRITDHKFDHTMFGFLHRSSIGSLWKFLKHETSWHHCVENIKAFMSLPAVYCGAREDFWLRDFDRFLELERDMKATFFFIPFKGRAGEKVQRPHAARRAAAYDVADERTLVSRLISAGNEVSVHGLDAWHSVERGREERARIAETSGTSASGVRMHWLCFDASSPRVLEEAGFHYDSTSGYNETVGYRAGTHQVFQPSGARKLLELPLHIQDTALFYPGRSGSQGNRAWTLCENLIENASTYGGVLTVLWHTRSLAPERQWEDFYIRLLKKLKSRRVWFATAAEIVQWFRRRRAVSFKAADFSGDTIRLAFEPGGDGGAAPNVVIRIHAGGMVHDISWKGKRVMNLSLAELGSF